MTNQSADWPEKINVWVRDFDFWIGPIVLFFGMAVCIRWMFFCILFFWLWNVDGREGIVNESVAWLTTTLSVKFLISFTELFFVISNFVYCPSCSTNYRSSNHCWISSDASMIRFFRWIWLVGIFKFDPLTTFINHRKKHNNKQNMQSTANIVQLHRTIHTRYGGKVSKWKKIVLNCKLAG